VPQIATSCYEISGSEVTSESGKWNRKLDKAKNLKKGGWVRVAHPRIFRIDTLKCKRTTVAIIDRQAQEGRAVPNGEAGDLGEEKGQESSDSPGRCNSWLVSTDTLSDERSEAESDVVTVTQ
jgi:hypothetical protein